MKRCKGFTACSEEADTPENIGRWDVELWNLYEVAVRQVCRGQSGKGGWLPGEVDSASKGPGVQMGNGWS